MSELFLDCINTFKTFFRDIFKCGPKTYKRTLFLLFILPILPVIPELKMLDNGIYYSITIGLCAYIFLINFPVLVKIFHGKPMYYEDLEDQRYSDHHSRKQHQSIFIVTNQIMIAIIVTCLVYYYQYRYKESQLALIEVAGILYSFSGFLLAIYDFVGKIAKSGIAYFKKKKSKRIYINKSKIRRLTFSLSDLDIISQKKAAIELVEVKKNDGVAVNIYDRQVSIV